MAQLYRLQGQIELKCEADKFFDVWAHKIYLVQKICPDKVQKTVLNKGEWHKPGAELTGYYVISKFLSSTQSLFIVVRYIINNFFLLNLGIKL